MSASAVAGLEAPRTCPRLHRGFKQFIQFERRDFTFDPGAERSRG